MEENLQTHSSLPPEPVSFGTRLINVFASPSEAYDGLVQEAPRMMTWFMPFVASILITVVMTMTMFNNEILFNEIKESQERALDQRVEQGAMTREQANQATEGMEAMGKGMFVAIGAIGAVVAVTAFFFLGALLLWLVAKIGFKATFSYGKTLEAYGLSAWIGVLGTIITLMMMVGLGSLYATPSFAMLVYGSFDPLNQIHKLLNGLNFFSIWSYAVFGIGLAKMSGKSVGSGIGVTLGIYLLFVVVTAFVF